MAFVSNDIDDEDKQPNAQGAVSPVAGGAVHLAPQSGVGASVPTGAGTSSPQGAGGQFATLDKYVAANQGQAEPLAGKITGQIGEQYSALGQENQGILQNIAGQVYNAPGYTKGNADLLAQEAANPVSFAGDTGNVAAFQKQLTNSYGGPQSAEGVADYQSQQAKINNAIAQGQAQTSTGAGRTQLVAQSSAKPTAGVTALNSAILSQDPNSLNKVETAYKPFQNLVTGLGAGAADINKTIAQEQADAAASSKAARDAITGQMAGLNTAVTGQLAAAQQDAAAKNAAIKAALASGNIFLPGAQAPAQPATGAASAYGNRNNPNYVAPTPQAASPGQLNPVLESLGLTTDQWNALSSAQKDAATSQVVSSADKKFRANTGTASIDPTAWLTQQDPNAVLNVSNVATPEQYQKAQAFQTLLNGLNLDTPTLAISPSTASQAGTAPTSLNAFDYQSALSNAQSTRAAETAAAQAYVDALQAGADEEHAQLAAQNAQKNAAMLNVANLAQTPIAATNAAVRGLYGAGQNAVNQAQNTISSPRNAAINIAENIATGGMSSAGQAIAHGVTQAVNTVTNIFCFHPWTPVEMANGIHKPIWKVQVGDWTRGGRVLATTRGVGTQFYWYDGILVTGKHAVRENGRWVRVENSNGGRQFPYLTEVVCNLVTEKHRIWANGIEFADEHETDLYESLSLDESLAALNDDEPVR